MRVATTIRITRIIIILVVAVAVTVAVICGILAGVGSQFDNCKIIIGIVIVIGIVCIAVVIST